jgi:PhoH-like ATPase
MKKPNLLVVDTNVLISDSEAILELMKGGNTVVIPWTVIFELDKLKTDLNIGSAARSNLRLIRSLQKEENKFLLIERRMNYSNIKSLDPKNPDHQIIAVLNSIVRHHLPSPKQRAKSKEDLLYERIKLVSNDNTMIILARELFKDYDNKVIIESYRRNRVEIKSEPIIEVIKEANWPEINPGSVISLPNSLEKLKENDGVLITSVNKTNLAMRKGGDLVVLDENISVAGIKARSLNGNGPNWSQVLAIHQLTDKGVSCVFLEGGAGTGKTLLAIAAAIAQSDVYDNILVMRPMIHLSDKDNMGFLPGDINQKTSPWLKPIEYNLGFLHNLIVREQIKLPKVKGKNKLKKNGEEEDKSLFELYNIEIQSLDYIRGLTLPNLFAIIDESQNLTPSQMKTIITRAGRGSKLVFTGDLSQIDVRYLTQETSGLAHAISKLHDNVSGKGSPMIGKIVFTDSLRSALASLAVDYL